MNGKHLKVVELFGTDRHQHEHVLPEQFVPAHETPEQRLYAALIEIGLDDLGGAYDADVREWFASHAEHPGSFAHACYVLHMDPDVVREWVLS